MSVALHLTLELEKFGTEYRNLDSAVMDIVNHRWEENKFDILVDGRLVRHDIDIDETEFYILKTEYRLSTCILIDEHIDNMREFMSKMKINDFMINSYMENKMFNIKVKNVIINDYCQLELV